MFPLLCYSLLFLIFLLTCKLIFQTRRKFRNLPPGPPFLPIIGNLHLLQPPLHLTFQRISQKYGNIFSLRFGSRLVIVSSSQSAFQECFTKNDVVLANRPYNIAGKYIFYNCTTIGSCSYGDHWINLRRISTQDLLSIQRVHSFSGIRRDETNRVIHQLVKECSCLKFEQVELSFMLHNMMYNNLMRMISGKRYYGEEIDAKDAKEAKEFRETVEEMVKLTGVSNKADYLPFLRWFDFQNLEKRLQNISNRFDAILNALIYENRSKMKPENTLIDHLLKLQESQPEYYTDQIIKGLILAMLFAGSNSTAVTLEWAMSNLLNHPEVLKKAKEEMDTYIGQDHLLNEVDLPKLPYLKKVVLETLRMYPPAPLLFPHLSSDDIVMEGFNVPRDTIVLTNGWSMQRDPLVWNEPTHFIPERFDKEGEEKKLVVFGFGRRSCPGKAMALHNVSFILGLLIQCFDWKRVSEAKIDMSDQNLFTSTKLVPLKAMCKVRPIINKINLNN